MADNVNINPRYLTYNKDKVQELLEEIDSKEFLDPINHELDERLGLEENNDPTSLLDD